jgi:KamA family protein
MRILEKEYKAYRLKDLSAMEQIRSRFSEREIKRMVNVAKIIPFRVNNYVTEELIDWANVPDDPIFRLTFPHEDMLLPQHMDLISASNTQSFSRKKEKALIHSIRLQLNPHPNGQRHNIPSFKGNQLFGVQHKYNETVLFFPGAGQTCHAYCTFCFRWPQFTKMEQLRFGSQQVNGLIDYLSVHPEVTDVLITGGDPMIMSASKLEQFIKPLLNADLPNLKNIRIGTKSLSYWPYRFLSDKDADQLLRLFETVIKKGKHLAFMAHFNHPAELQTPALKKAVKRIQGTGAIIRTQSPVLNHINNDAKIWVELWSDQVAMGMVPYYMFVARDTGAKHYFEIPLIDSFRLYKKAFKHVSGLARTVRGPSMSTYYGKIQILGTQRIGRSKLFILQFLQARNKVWNNNPFFAKFSESATWLNELLPAFGEEQFFFEKDQRNLVYN